MIESRRGEERREEGKFLYSGSRDVDFRVVDFHQSMKIRTFSIRSSISWFIRICKRRVTEMPNAERRESNEQPARRNRSLTTIAVQSQAARQSRQEFEFPSIAPISNLAQTLHSSNSPTLPLPSSPTRPQTVSCSQTQPLSTFQPLKTQITKKRKSISGMMFTDSIILVSRISH